MVQLMGRNHVSDITIIDLQFKIAEDSLSTTGTVIKIHNKSGYSVATAVPQVRLNGIIVPRELLTWAETAVEKKIGR